MDKNYNERMRLFKDANKIKITDTQLKQGCELIKRKMNRNGQTYLETHRNGKKVFVGWIEKWGDSYIITFMGYTYKCAFTFEEAVTAILQLGLALHNNDYTFHYDR